MVRAFFNLLTYSGKAFLAALGTTRLGFIVSFVFAVASIVTTLVVVYRRRGREAMLAHWKQDAKTALLVTFICGVTVYFPLFLWEIITTVYEDHVQFVATNSQLEHRLDFRGNHGISFRIGGVVSTDSSPQSMLQLIITAVNDGEPSRIRDWKANIISNGTTTPGIYVFGRPRLNGVPPNVSDIDSRLQSPLETGEEVHGYVSFLFIDMPRYEKDPNAALTLSAVDSFGKTIIAQMFWRDLRAQSHSKFTPNKEF
jgi:hypothetical protein